MGRKTPHLTTDLGAEIAGFCAHVLEFCAEDIYHTFLAYMVDIGYDEGEVERLTAAVMKAAGRS